MNQKGFANIIIIGIAVVILLGIAGYFVLVKQPPTLTQQTPPSKETITPTSSSETSTKGITPPSGTKSVVKISSSPAKLSTSGAPAEPVDQALVEITALSQTEDGWKISIDKIRDYIRYPAATNPQLKVGDTVSIRFTGWLDTFQNSDKVCPTGYIKSPKPAQAESTTQPPATRPQPKIIVGEKYLAKLYGCFAEIGGFTCPNQKSGWSGGLYNPYPIVVEYECVKQGTTVPPSVEPQQTPPSVEPQQ